MGSQDQGAGKEFKGVSQDYIGLFCKKLISLERSKNPYEKFRDFCEMVYCTYAQRAPGCDQEKADKLEARYMQIVDTYPNKDTVRAYPEMLAWAAIAIANRQEFLGAAAERLELLDKHSSQFFTPHHVSKMMAQMTIGDPGPLIKQNGFITVSEPACGSGGMILAVADVIEDCGYDPSKHMLVQAADISPLCYHMTYIQLTLRGVPAAVIQANSLSMEQFDSAWTPQVGPFFEMHGRLFDANDPKSDGQPPPDYNIGEHGQLGLF